MMSKFMRDYVCDFLITGELMYLTKIKLKLMARKNF